MTVTSHYLLMIGRIGVSVPLIVSTAMSNFGRHLLGVGIFASATVLTLAGTAQASLVSATGDPVSIYLDGHPSGLGLSEQRIFLDHGHGTTVDGKVGKNGPVVDFTSGGATLDATRGFKNGEITRREHDDSSSVFHSLTISVPGYTFGDFLFNVDLLENRKDKSDLTITVNFTSGAPEVVRLNGDFDKNGDGDLHFLLLDKLGATIISTITSIALYSRIGFEDFSHFQISDLVDPPATTPIPGAVWLFGTVLAGAAGVGRWRKRRVGAVPA